MSARRFRRVDRRTAGQQGPGGTPDRARALDELLADAAAPAHASELAGEEAAVAAFRSARLAETTQPRRWSMHRLTKLFTVKAAAVAIGAMAAGGVAFAAATGNLPSQDSPAVPATTSNSATAPAEDSGKGNPTDKNTPNSEKPGTDRPGNGKPANENGNNPAPSPSEHGLCQAYTSAPEADRGKRLESPAFEALITAAGGKDKVPAFCVTVLGQRPNEQKTNEHKPSEPGKPTQPAERGNTEQPQPGKPNGTPPSERPNN
ncbi:prolipoprotein diacylglyceryl transferase [Kibdelosporangium aridum]|uniref:Uncharacterized protein n=1 Tax=Kibdelosporangium aridum TaxID=2030 RepID=A0A1W2ELL9_KIBAR|nr:hypothetical protein [Kibdelosporangium aridum]SMD10196.1 hypothetical protein SAMN05661093_04582 [Kibdelosporangium aridum]